VQQGLPCCEPVPHFQVRDLLVNYGQHCVLSEVSLDIYRGCITAVIGPSGCGKSTFLSSLNRLLDLTPDARVSGSVQLNGKEVLAPGVDLVQLRHTVGMVFQKPNPFPLSIRQNLELPLREHGERNRRDIAEKSKPRFGTPGYGMR
jgi:phosphate transport system ATP-binding protein